LKVSRTQIRLECLFAMTLLPDKDFDLHQMTLDYNYDTRQGPDCLLLPD